MKLLIKITFTVIFLSTTSICQAGIETKEFFLLFEEQCGEGMHFCNKVKFTLIEKKSCTISNPEGWANIRYCSGGKTPCEHMGYQIKYNNFIYAMKQKYPKWQVWYYDQSKKQEIVEMADETFFNVNKLISHCKNKL